MIKQVQLYILRLQERGRERKKGRKEEIALFKDVGESTHFNIKIT